MWGVDLSSTLNECLTLQIPNMILALHSQTILKLMLISPQWKGRRNNHHKEDVEQCTLNTIHVNNHI